MQDFIYLLFKQARIRFVVETSTSDLLNSKPLKLQKWRFK